MTEQPSSYRCETCENTDCKYNHLKGQIGRTRKWNGNELKEVTFTPTAFTEEMGCASHSAFNIPPVGATPGQAPPDPVCDNTTPIRQGS